MQRVTFPVNPGKGKHSALIMRSCFSSLLFSSFFSFFFLRSLPVRLRWKQLRHWSSLTSSTSQHKCRWLQWLRRLIFFFQPPLQILFFFFFLVKKHYIISLKNIRQFELAVIHPVTITLVVCIVKPVRTVSQKQIIKLTALTLGKVREELSNTLMLTLLQSLYLNNSPGS